MKKYFCKLPPLQWGAFLAALIAAILQTVALLSNVDIGTNYFKPGSFLHIIAALFAILSFGFSIAPLLKCKGKPSPVAYPSKLRKLHLFPALGFLAALAGLLWEVAQKSITLWEKHDDGLEFLSELLAGEAKLAFFCLPLLLCAVFYCLRWAFSKEEGTVGITLLGFATIAACVLLAVHIYFDFSIEMNAPVKTMVQGGVLSTMIFFTTELRSPLKMPCSKLLLVTSGLMLAMASISAISIPAAFFAQTLPGNRFDHFCYAILIASMIPVAIEHIPALHATVSDSNTERTSL